ncbi:hypothetical protein HDU78_011841, partial [Chytriomyces hyalinus]
MREREAIACTVLTSGVSHAALESRFPFSNLFVDNVLPQSPPPPPVIIDARNDDADKNASSTYPFTGYPTIYSEHQQPQGFRSTFVIPSSNISSGSDRNYTGNACKTSIKFL